MMPATPAKIIPKIKSFIKGSNIKYPITAPRGSDTPDKKEYIRAFFLLQVEK